MDYIRVHSHSACYAVSMPAPVVQQVLSSMKIVMGRDNTDSGKSFTLPSSVLLFICSFTIHGPVVWNCLPCDLQLMDILLTTFTNTEQTQK